MAKRKKMTADEKADQKVKYYQSLEDKYQKRWKNSEQKGMDTYKKMQATNDKKEKAKLNTRWKKITKTVGADNNARKRYKKLRENAESERDALHKQQGDLAAIADKIAQHNAQFSIDPSSSSNEGHAAIYPSDGSQNLSSFPLVITSQKILLQTLLHIQLMRGHHELIMSVLHLRRYQLAVSSLVATVQKPMKSLQSFKAGIITIKH